MEVKLTIKLSLNIFLINLFNRCHHARLYDCKARFQTKGDKIQKPFLLHTHPLDVKPPVNSSMMQLSNATTIDVKPGNSSMIQLSNATTIDVNPMDILKLNDTI